MKVMRRKSKTSSSRYNFRRWSAGTVLATGAGVFMGINFNPVFYVLQRNQEDKQQINLLNHMKQKVVEKENVLNYLFWYCIGIYMTST